MADTVKQTLLALRPKEALALKTSLATFKPTFTEGEKLLDVAVKNQKVFESNSQTAAKLAKATKDIDGIRKDANAEHHASVKHNNALVLPMTQLAEKLVRAIRSQNDVYLREQQRIQREKEEQARRIEEGRIKAQETREAKGQKVKPVEDLAPVARPVDFKKTTGVRISKVWQWKITNYAKVPEEFKKHEWQRASIDGIAVIGAGRQGEEIPGLEVWAEDRSY